MLSNFTFLDYLWKSLFIVATISSVTLIFGLILELIFVRYTLGKERKWYFNFQSVLLLISIIFGFAIVKVDPEIVSECFTKFVQSTDSFTITRLIALSYLAVFILLILMDTVKTVLSFKRILSYEPFKNCEIEKKILTITSNLGISKSIKVFECKDETSPFVFGLLKYRLCMPTHLIETKEDERIEALVSHELAHINGNDTLWLIITHICKRALFFVPFVYLFNSKHQQAAELAADEFAILKGHIHPKNLVNALVNMASFKSADTTVLQANATMGFENLKERIISVRELKKKKRLDWKFLLSASSALLTLAWLAMAQASAIKAPANNYAEFMCTQIQHEKIIETWLKIQSSSNRCE